VDDITSTDTGFDFYLYFLIFISEIISSFVLNFVVALF